MSRSRTILNSLFILLLCLASLVRSNDCSDSHDDGKRKVCTVTPSLDGSDDVPAVIAAFQECKKYGRVEFLNETYHMESIMNTTGLDDVEVDLKGTLLWGTNISYWLNNSLPMGYQNQSTAWIFGGHKINFQGHGYGTFDGNGQVWYDFINGTSNYPRRPHAITISETTDSVFEGLRFVQSQMWTMTLIHSASVLLHNIYVSSTSSTSASTSNTDGADTIYSNNITFSRWSITNGDDGISAKANSTNILVTDSEFFGGSGLALGSIGQYDGVFERIENFTAKGCTFKGTLHAAYLKTWTGQQVGYPPNGGGGGVGYIKNVLLQNFTLHNVTLPLSFTQCISYSGVAGDCNSSLFQLENVSMVDVRGTALEEPVASLQCSAKAPCDDTRIQGVSLKLNNGTAMREYNCNNAVGTVGFNCTGSTCDTSTVDGTC